MANDELLKVAEDRVSHAETVAAQRGAVEGFDAAVARVEGLHSYIAFTVKIVPVANQKTSKWHGRKVYTWSERLPNGMVTRPVMVSRKTLMQRIAEHLETQG